MQTAETVLPTVVNPFDLTHMKVQLPQFLGGKFRLNNYFFWTPSLTRPGKNWDAEILDPNHFGLGGLRATSEVAVAILAGHCYNTESFFPTFFSALGKKGCPLVCVRMLVPTRNVPPHKIFSLAYQ